MIPNFPNNPNLPNSRRPGYEYLAAYQLGLANQQLTEEFTARWIESTRRRQQMDEASRSVPQNIAEGYTQESLKGYIYLSGIAHGSNEELGRDYARFLQGMGFAIWPKDDARVRVFRGFRVRWISQNTLNVPKLPADPEEAANLLATLCSMESYLLSRLIASLYEKHRIQGGLTERLYRARKQYRGY